MAPESSTRPVALVEIAGSSILIACFCYFAFETIHWPLVGDAALMHYVAFLMDHGMRPYRDIAEMNMPAAFLVDHTVMHMLGRDALAWRIFDLLLGGTAMAAMIVISRPKSWFGGIWAGVLLALIHGADGIFDMGQRDLVAAVLLLVGCAALFLAVRRERPLWMLLFGLCTGAAVTEKPTFIFVGPALLLAAVMLRPVSVLRNREFIGWGAAGYAAPLLGILVWLARCQSLVPFLHTVTGLMAYHAALGRQPIGFLLLHSVSPLLFLVLVWVIVFVIPRRGPMNWETSVLWICIVSSLLSYVIQGKGYPYQRYPLLAFLLLAMGTDFDGAILQGRALRRYVALGCFGIGTLWVGPSSAWAASHYDGSRTEFQVLLERDLGALGGPTLSGHVQCLDTTGGCYQVLYDMGLVQSSGFLYDEIPLRTRPRGRENSQPADILE